MNHDLTRYINDHLAGSSGALLLVDKISAEHDDPEAREFFKELHGRIRKDREVLDGLLRSTGNEPSALMKIAGGAAARVGGLKLMWEKVKPGELGMFEALEMLAIGIQGKRLLWIALREIQGHFPEWHGTDFNELEREAVTQRNRVERWRLRAATECLPSGR